jgi:hypothetical protein
MNTKKRRHEEKPFVPSLLRVNKLEANQKHKLEYAVTMRLDMIRVVLPQHLRTLARTGREVTVEINGPVTQRSILDALEDSYPMLRGTIRDHTTQQRRAFLRFFACEQDMTHESPDATLPDDVVTGKEPFMVVGAMAGG